VIANLLLCAVILAIQDRPADPAAELAVVRTLYGTASYDEALARLARITPTGPLQDQLDTYRALCLPANCAQAADQNSSSAQPGTPDE
jgi:hypothetical protein